MYTKHKKTETLVLEKVKIHLKVILYIFGDGRRFNVFFERRKRAVLKFFGIVFPYFQVNVLKRFFASVRNDKRLKKFRSYFLSSVIMMYYIKFREIIVERGW